MEILLLIVIVWAAKGAWDHASQARAASRDQRVAEVAKTYPKGVLPKSRQKAAARQHAAGWWAREVRHGFPVTRTGWHAAWLAHQTTADHHKARREEARTTALETRASVLKGMPEHRQRQAEAQAELDAIREELAAQQAKGSPATGRKAVREASDEVSRKRAEKAAGGTCPSCGAPDGYEHLKGCDPTAPPLPADAVPRQRDDLAEHVKAPMPDPRLNHRQRDRDLNGQRNICAACGHPGTQTDDLVIRDGFRVHQSHTHDPASGYYEGPAPERIGDLPGGPMYDRLPDGTRKSDDDRHAEIDDAVIGADHGFEGEYDTHPSPTTQGAPVTADTNYTTVLTNAKGFAAQADEDAQTARSRRMLAEHHAEEMQAAEVDPATLSSQMDLVEKLREAEKAAEGIGESATSISDGLQQRHGGLKQAHDDAPIAHAAKREFYEEG